MTPIAIVCVAALASSLQEHPDFSGRWTLDGPLPPSPDAARVLVVDQPVTRTNVRGEPMPPAYLYLTVRREGPSGTDTETYVIGTITHFETVWRGDSLTFLMRRDGWMDRTRAIGWSEVYRGRSTPMDLRVEIETEAHDRAHETTVLRYRRQQAR